MFRLCELHLLIIGTSSIELWKLLAMYVDSTKEGYKAYSKWKYTWSSNAKCEANVKLFLVDQYLPFWVQCTSCGRWRQLPRETNLTPELLSSYKCDASLEVIALFISLSLSLFISPINMVAEHRDLYCSVYECV